mmetsp:Transcript_15574/g.23050  ORF Transcript_15574/g.23050 Transcript_15574/m.23050 type:complete len:249 (-) Transcript_15574:589-1335(-)
MKTSAVCLLALSQWRSVHSFTTSSSSHHPRSVDLFASSSNEEDGRRNFLAKAATAAAVALIPNVAFADTIGKETEAPTLSTGEAVMICKKRGPLGACTETALRTAENDNDKASQYFVDPAKYVKARQDALAAAEKESEGNALIIKLRQQTEDNKERNELIVRQKTIENDQSASFGPFDRQVVIMNTDGKTYTLLQNPQAMRLKKAGFIVDRRFVTQPTKEELDKALNPEEEQGGGIGGIFSGIFGGGD